MEAWNKWRSENRDVRPDLRGADLIGADLIGAYLDGADLRHADLRHAYLRHAYLNHANFTDVELGFTTFADNDLSEVKGLESAIHVAPSDISIGTLYKTAGKIPESFLRGCGLSDRDIEYAKLSQPEL